MLFIVYIKLEIELLNDIKIQYIYFIYIIIMRNAIDIVYTTYIIRLEST